MPIPRLPHRTLYAAFDVFPSAKGAATHIARAARTLFDAGEGGLLAVLGREGLPSYQLEDTVEILRASAEEPHFLDRAAAFRRFVADACAAVAPSLELVQFRDPWGGLALVRNPARRYRIVYEVNGLPSIELPDRYPALAASTLAKIAALEDECLAGADAVVTPSATIAGHLEARGVDPARIRVIRNGADPVDLDVSRAGPRPLAQPYLIYVGALQPWQGLPTLFRAFARLADLRELRLVVVASNSERAARPLRQLAERLAIADRVVWRHEAPREEVANWLVHAIASVAPLTAARRNLDQGCCPIKILESMAAGVPVVASDLPAVREIVTAGLEGELVRADRPEEFARALRILIEFPERRARMGHAARERIVAGLTWGHADAAHRELCDRLLQSGRANPGAEPSVAPSGPPWPRPCR